ncbi:hypothetical protein EDI_056750 [Entamoeba dispar SAW760]|uniref:Uncharacterized protein n=1 Tax=Entamoeba dispar (strain ATCC PRA-260 / SAW760) TaxID=370354 RepID=B0EMH2_ENTDS|nr:uncharacterized protein EDI_056750 [Entamoeba dispar SAW760]EDR24278.1 hypothetical protein EDI_056750 [Entamoeba dispar SAW760]|eukprot:EDR24278.1 hypothetical protein EDI_056750 [Entamoeba dispar SAW760]
MEREHKNQHDEIQQQYDMHFAHEQLTYRYFKEMQEIRKKDRQQMKKINEEERIARAETMYQLEDGQYFIKNGTLMYKLSSKDIVAKASVH